MVQTPADSSDDLDLDLDLIVVGAGAAGLASAARLASQGLKVLVLEKNGEGGRGEDGDGNDGEVGGASADAALGGRTGAADVGDGCPYRFERGPSLMLLPDVYREAFVAAGPTGGCR